MGTGVKLAAVRKSPQCNANTPLVWWIKEEAQFPVYYFAIAGMLSQLQSILGSFFANSSAMSIFGILSNGSSSIVVTGDSGLYWLNFLWNDSVIPNSENYLWSFFCADVHFEMLLFSFATRNYNFLFVLLFVFGPHFLLLIYLHTVCLVCQGASPSVAPSSAGK